MRVQCVYGSDFHEIARTIYAAQKSLLTLYQIIKPDFPSLADVIAEPHPDMDI